jgi:hypothetical protein
VNNKGLEQRGLVGDSVRVELKGNSLLVQGSEGGSFRIEAARVDRIRQFRMEAVHSLHSPLPAMFETKIWWDGARKPALLIPYEDHRSYRAVIGSFARAVAAARGLERLRLGPGYATGIINLLIVGPPSLMLFAMMIWLSFDQGGWWWIAGALVFMLFFWLAGRNIVSRWPRRAGSIEAFEEELEP